MFAVILTGRAGNIHKDIVATIKIALLEADPYWQCCMSIRFGICDMGPAGDPATLFMYHVRYRSG